MGVSAHPYLFAPGVHFCMTQDHLVFLDLHNDAYCAVPAAPPDPTDADARVRETLARNAEALSEAGLTRSAQQGGQPAKALVRAHPASHFLGPDEDRRLFGRIGARRMTAQSAWRAASASWLAGHWLRRRPIARIVAETRARKSSSTIEAHAHVCDFAAFRPWWPRGYLCLFDSLALALYLSECGVAADWVFGVQVQPWGAHCWIECDGRLVNESVEYAARFTPIMVV